VRYADVGKFIEQIFVRSDAIKRHPSIAEDGNKVVHNVVREFPPIPRVGRRPSWII